MWRAALSVVAVTLGAAAPEASAAAPYDFNNDGYQELVAGMPDLRDGPSGEAGAVLVVPGAPKGPRLPRRRTITQSSPGVPDESERSDSFGRALASGDFDGDGYADLAISSGEGYAAQDRGEGAVTVVYGGPGGLTSRANQLAGQSTPGAGGDDFGSSVVAGDVDRDEFTDLVVGARWELTAADGIASGGVRIFFGGPLGITELRQRRLARPTPRHADFGAVLALGDVNRDGHLDLVEGGPAYSQPTIVLGHLSYCPGGPDGPTRCRTVAGGPNARVRKSKEPPDGPESLAIGDVTGDGFPDVVEGIRDHGWPEADGIWGGGAVLIRRGTVRGPSKRRWKTDEITFRRFGFGNAVAVGRIDRDRHADIVVGSVADDMVGMLRGARSGVRRGGASIPPPPGAGTSFGAAVALLDHNGDRRLDLTVGSEGDGGDGYSKHGTVTTFMGRRGGFDTRRPKRIDAEALGLRRGAWTGLGWVLGG